MSSHTARMVALLAAFRRERNGLVADTMHYDGTRYGLNYGVSLTTVRAKVAQLEPQRDHLFARFLLRQEVRCLQLAALHLATPEALTDPQERAQWHDALRNSELAEEAAFALLRYLPDFENLFRAWVASENHYASYGALMAAARVADPQAAWLQPSLEALRRDESRLTLQATVNLWAHIAQTDRAAVEEALASLVDTPREEYLREELAWRLEA